MSSHVAAIPGRILLPRKKSWLVTTLPQDMEPMYLLLDLGALPSLGLVTRDKVPTAAHLCCELRCRQASRAP